MKREMKIVCREEIDKKRKILEVINIIKNERDYDFKTDADAACRIYLGT